jgi:hypothetical protein
MRQDDDGENSHFTCGCYLKGSERDDCKRKPSPIYFPRRERRTTVDWEVCDYPRVRRLGVILCYRRTIVFLDEIHRFTRPQQVFNAFATAFIFFNILRLSGSVHPFHRTGFCASKQHREFMLFDSSHVDHRGDDREPIIQVKSDVTQSMSVRTRKSIYFAFSRDATAEFMSSTAWLMKM